MERVYAIIRFLGLPTPAGKRYQGKEQSMASSRLSREDGAGEDGAGGVAACEADASASPAPSSFGSEPGGEEGAGSSGAHQKQRLLKIGGSVLDAQLQKAPHDAFGAARAAVRQLVVLADVDEHGALGLGFMGLGGGDFGDAAPQLL